VLTVLKESGPGVELVGGKIENKSGATNANSTLESQDSESRGDLPELFLGMMGSRVGGVSIRGETLRDKVSPNRNLKITVSVREQDKMSR
jgi:hypothetical protein